MLQAVSWESPALEDPSLPSRQAPKSGRGEDKRAYSGPNTVSVRLT